MASINYVKDADANQTFQRLIEHKTDDNKNDIVHIKKTDKLGEEEYKPGSNTIKYNPQSGLIVQEYDPKKKTYKDTDEVQSPALGLLHEGAHAANDLFDHKNFSARRSSNYFPDALFEEVKMTLSDFNYHWKNAEEYNVVTKTETPAAKKLGEPVRNNYGGGNIKTKGPTSREKYEEPKK